MARKHKVLLLIGNTVLTLAGTLALSVAPAHASSSTASMCVVDAQCGVSRISCEFSGGNLCCPDEFGCE